MTLTQQICELVVFPNSTVQLILSVNLGAQWSVTLLMVKIKVKQ